MTAVRIGRQRGLPRGDDTYDRMPPEERAAIRRHNVKLCHERGWDHAKIARRLRLDPQLVDDILAEATTPQA